MRVAQPAPPELVEWLSFTAVREGRARSRRRELFESFELFAASEGHAAISELAFVRHLEAVGLRRRGTTFLGVRLRCRIHPIRLLTRLEIYGFRFALHGDELAWRGPTAVSDLERRVIARHRPDLIAALRQIEEAHARLRGQPPTPRAATSSSARCAA